MAKLVIVVDVDTPTDNDPYEVAADVLYHYEENNRANDMTEPEVTFVDALWVDESILRVGHTD